ncbi:porin [Ferruginibacter sp. SUN106]|uniref:porin n=1 Tax=Ferruginibacter sp. SUN106 TaxID=2978348 RepID=UPI003D36E5F9
MLKKKLLLTVVVASFCQLLHAQFLMDMVDTTKDIGKGMLSIYKKFDNVRIGGYIQPEFQLAQTKGEKSFDGGDFATNASNRFMLRRGRIRFEYVHFAEQKGPSIQFVFQFDGTERGVFIRDFWGRVFENKYKVFAFTGGMFARPFSYELNLSSSDRESPERGRMSQLLMKTERDLGAMVSFEPRVKNHPLYYLKIDAGLFNGQGLAATADFDSHKDFICRMALKPLPVSNKLQLSAAVSYLNGGMLQNTQYLYRTGSNNFGKTFIADSSVNNTGKIAPRKYYGADMQLKFKTKAGYTELRAELMFGQQTGTSVTSETPAALLAGNDGYYIRKFNGTYFYLLHNIFSRHHQIGIKYDWYDPNAEVKGNDIGKTGTNLNSANIKYSTLGFGYIHYINDNVKLLLWYEKVTNEKTSLPGFTSDVKDDVFTCRLQFRF